MKNILLISIVVFIFSNCKKREYFDDTYIDENNDTIFTENVQKITSSSFVLNYYITERECNVIDGTNICKFKSISDFKQYDNNISVSVYNTTNREISFNFETKCNNPYLYNTDSHPSGAIPYIIIKPKQTIYLCHSGSKKSFDDPIEFITVSSSGYNSYEASKSNSIVKKFPVKFDILFTDKFGSKATYTIQTTQLLP